jgi:polyferredoxin
MKLRILRIVLALVTFTILTFFFLDFAGLFPQQYFTLAAIQFVPALLAGSFVIVGVLVALTLVFGRVYCSMICPLGIYMDVVTWIRKRFKPRMKQTYSKEKRWLRLSVLAAVLVSYFAGVTVVVSLLDPYSAFGRMVTHLFRPVYMAGNNVLADIFSQFGIYTFYHTDIFLHSLVSLLIALATLAVVSFLAARHGRTWCNTLCPVGTVLGYLSTLSLFKIRIDESTCISCGKCAKTCKASCIDSKHSTIDTSRCVACFDCIDSCSEHSITYGLKRKKLASQNDVPVDESKRQFMGALAVSALAVPSTLLAQTISIPTGRVPFKRSYPISPPGSISADHLLDHCTSCHLCVAKCPSQVLKPALLEYGVGGLMMPVMNFDHGFCNFDCTLCTDVCPTDALKPLTVQAKHKTQMGRVVFIMHNCVVFTDETSCGACSEHCPTQAVKMVPYKGMLTIPSVNPDICVGCGGCEYVCPAVPFKAIHVEGNPVQLEAQAFKDEEKKEVQLDGFGF